MKYFINLFKRLAMGWFRLYPVNKALDITLQEELKTGIKGYLKVSSYIIIVCNSEAIFKFWNENKNEAWGSRGEYKKTPTTNLFTWEKEMAKMSTLYDLRKQLECINNNIK